MNEQTERSIADIQTEYAKAATLLGQAEYQVYAIKLEISSLKEKMRELNVEASKLKAKEEEEKKDNA